MMSVTLPTEEDLRSRLLVPYLTALGIDQSQIRLERSFRIRLGRTVVDVDTGKDREVIGGRLDILVTNAAGENLFIVEAKAPGQQLTDDDRDQGISYARLLNQIAPFVLVTNGQVSRLYDTITRQELTETDPSTSSFWRSGMQQLASAEDVRIRFEALSHFLGYSRANVQAFSQAQHARRMEHLRGDLADASKKYIPELYVGRTNVSGALQRFIEGDGVAFALVGSSGTGKTNELCALAERLKQEHVTLFFSGGNLHAGIVDTLADEFNWHFSEHVRPPALIRRLADIGTQTGKCVIVIIDAIDEAVVPAFAESLSDFAGRLRDYAGTIKLIVSCKSEEWRRFEVVRDDPSPLALSLDRNWPVTRSEGDGRIPSEPFILAEFSEAELKAAITTYSSFFRLPSPPSGRMRTHCRLPFFLRVVGELYSNSSTIPWDISEQALLREWLERKLSRMRDPSRARRELEDVARAAYWHALERGVGRQTIAELERVPESSIRELAGSAVGASVGEELVAHGVLMRHRDGDGRVSLSFYFSRVRDYVIARYVLRLDEMSPEHFRTIVDELFSGTNPLLQSVLFWHLRYAADSHRRVVEEALRGRAASFLSAYERILDEMVPGLKAKLDPSCSGPIGIAYEVDDHGLRYFGFYPVGAASDRRIQQLRPIYDGAPLPFARMLFALGGKTARGGLENFTNTNPYLAASEFAHKRIIEAIDEGRLDESASKTLVAEAIVALATEHRKLLGFPPASDFREVMSGVAPLDLNELAVRLHSYLGEVHLKAEWAEQQVQRGTKHVSRIDDNAVRITYDDHAISELTALARAEASNGRRFPAHTINGSNDLGILAELVELALQSQQVIERPLLVPADLPAPHPDFRPHWGYSDEQLAVMLERLFLEGLEAYRALVDVNFPGLRDLFRNYARWPVTVVAVAHRPEPQAPRHDWGSVRYAILDESEGTNRVEVYVDPSEPIFRSDSSGGYAAWCRGRWRQTGWQSTRLSGLIHPYDAPGFRSKLRGRGAARLAPVRAFAYSLIQDDLRDISPHQLASRLAQLDG